MSKKANFIGSKSKGKSGEKLVVSILESLDVYCEIVSGKSPDYDIACKYIDDIFFIEVKNDIKAAYTGNIAIELYNTKTGQMSGLSVTKADFWAHIVKNEVWFIRTLDLMSIVREIRPTKVVFGGGDDNSYFYLYERSILNNPLFFLHHKELPEQTLDFILNGLKN